MLISLFSDRLPKISLENEKGLSVDQVKQLHKCLVKRANQLVGFEMIYELCQSVQEYLYDNNKPPAKSFYEQRLDEQQYRASRNEDDFDVKFSNNLSDRLDLVSLCII